MIEDFSEWIIIKLDNGTNNKRRDGFSTPTKLYSEKSKLLICLKIGSIWFLNKIENSSNGRPSTRWEISGKISIGFWFNEMISFFSSIFSFPK